MITSKPSILVYSAFFYLLLISSFKLDAQGITSDWSIHTGGSSVDFVHDIATDKDGNIYSTGFFRETVDFDPDASNTTLTAIGERDVFIQKIDPNGQFVWVKQIGGIGDDIGYNITIGLNGDIILAGNFTNQIDVDPGSGMVNYVPQGDLDAFIVSLDADGNYLWSNQIGSIEYCNVKDLEIDQFGNIFLSGDYLDDLVVNPNNLTITVSGSFIYASGYIMKFNSNGAYLLTRTISSSEDFYISSISKGKNGNLFFSGEFGGHIFLGTTQNGNFNTTSTGQSKDIIIGKLSTVGAVLWAKQIPISHGSSKTDIVFDQAGSVYTVGGFQGTVDFDPGPNQDFKQSSGSGGDAFIHKLSADGEYEWTKTFGANGSALATMVNLDKFGNIFTSGGFQGTIDFDPGPNSKSMNSFGQNRFIQKLNREGEYLWASQVSGISNTFNCKIDSSNHILISGSFFGSSDIDSSNSQYIVNSNNGSPDFFLNKLSQCYTITEIVETSCNNLIWINGINYSESTNDPYKVFYNWSGCDSIVTLDLTINSVSDVSASISDAGLVANNPNATYQWINCDDNANIAGETSALFTPTVDGEYAVVLTENGCVDTSDCIVYMKVGLDDVSKSEINIYPNPTENMLNIEFPSFSETVEVIIYDSKGAIVEQLTASHTNVVSMELNQPAGLYAISIRTNSKTYTERIIVK
jgi:hypothetical protein